MQPEHHHAHGPANRGRVVLSTAAPLFVCEPSTGPPVAAVIALHGRHGITAEFERGLRAVATHGYLVVAPFHYFRDGGPEYAAESSASHAYAALAEDEIDADVDAAVEHVCDRLGLRVAAVLGPDSVAAVVKRAGDRHPDVPAVTIPDVDGDPAAGTGSPAAWPAALEHLRCVTTWRTHS